MKRLNKKNIFWIVLIIVFAVMIGITIRLRNQTHDTNKIKDHSDKSKILTYNKEQAGLYTDYYNGYSFKMGSNYKAVSIASNPGEIVIYPTDGSVNGSVFLLAYTDNEKLTLEDFFYTIIPMKSDLSVYIDGDMNSIGYDYGNPQSGIVSGKEALIETPKIRYDNTFIKSQIYHFFGEDKEQIAVGYVAKDKASETILKQEAEQIVGTFSFYDAKERAEGTASNSGVVDLTTKTRVGDMSIQYPRNWQVISSDVDSDIDGRNATIIKASRAKNSNFKDAAIYIAEDTKSDDDPLDLTFNYAVMHKDGLGSALLQYPSLIQKGMTTVYDDDDVDTVNVLGKKTERRLIDIRVNAEDQERDVPYSGIVEKHAYLYTIDRNGKTYTCVFIFNGIDKFEMAKLSQKIMDTISF